MTDEQTVISSFHGAYRFLSNFYWHPVDLDGIIYPSVEHAYQASKTLDLDLREGIAQLNSPAVAKKIGRLVPLRPDWNDLKKTITMHDLLVKKFAMGTTMAKHLLATSPALLVEGNTWHDNFWGDCYCSKCREIVGQNRLGKLLMAHRENLWKVMAH